MPENEGLYKFMAVIAAAAQLDLDFSVFVE
jgi:hypothetical protein